MDCDTTASREIEATFVDPVSEIRRAVDTALAALDIDAMTDGELATDLVRLRRQTDRIESALTEMSVKARQRGVGLTAGYASTPAWQSWQTGQSRGAVGQIIRIGELVELLPETGRLWREGEITSTAVALIAAARVPGNDDKLVACEAEFLALAQRRDHKSLRIATQHFAALARADGSRPTAPDGITLSPVGDRTVVSGELHSDAAETITHALHAFTVKPDEADDSTPAERRAAALVRICELALKFGTDSGGAKPSVSYVVRRAEPGQLAEPTVGMFTGILDPWDRDRILCDCDLSRIVIGSKGETLDVGRATPTWTTAMRKGIVVRDQGCRWPGCEVPPPWCDVHHIVHWEHGGETSMANGCLFCRRHHTFHHRHPGWKITFDDQRVRVFRPDGRELDCDPWARLERAA